LDEYYRNRREELEEDLQHELAEMQDDVHVHELQIEFTKKKLEELGEKYAKEISLRRAAPALPVGYYKGGNRWNQKMIIEIEDYKEPFYEGQKVQQWSVMTPRELSWVDIEEEGWWVGERLDLFDKED